jgi:hypothetical protein
VDALEDEILSRIDDNIYCKDILNVLEELEETLALKDSINSGISKGEVPSAIVLNKLIRLVTTHLIYLDFPYNDPQDIFSLKEGELIRFELSDVVEKLRRSKVSWVKALPESAMLDKYLLSAYVTDYLGYSCNASKREVFTSEYVLTGLPANEYQDDVVKAQFFGLRILLNLCSVTADPERLKDYLAKSGGDFRLQLAYMLFDAVEMSINDVELVWKGKPVPLFKRPDEIELSKYKSGAYYRDYLRILVVILPQKCLLSRVRTCIETREYVNLANYYTVVSTQGVFRYDFRFIERNQVIERNFSAGY